MSFEEYWKQYWTPSTMPGALDEAMKEIACKAWNAALLQSPYSAAPDLLAALSGLLDAVRQNIDGVPPTADQIFAKAGNAAVAAIAKAEGR